MISADDYVVQLIQDRNLVTADAVEAARSDVAGKGVNAAEADSAILDLLVEKGYTSWRDISGALAAEFDMEVADLSQVRPSEEALKLVGRDMATRYNVLPLNMEGSSLLAVIADPLDSNTMDELSRLIRTEINFKLAPPEEIREAIVAAYDNSGDVGSEALRSIFGEGAEVSIPGNDEKGANAEDAPIIRYVNLLITEAIRRRASDIHMEPLEKRFRVRYRIDGVLQEVENPPKRLQASIVARLKLMANVSLAEKRIPQDGRIQIKVAGKDVDLRVSVLPTVYGESIVMRILDKEGLKLGLPELGFFSDDQEVFMKIITGADGIFLVTGPTGSGKSTTLYAALNYINQPDRKIITVEDPVEYQMPGINQVQVRREVGMTFAAALRSMLRQAPNIIMIGEIRDLETADIAVNASLTGHMVFSTLHTNDAPGAVSRLVDIGVKPFLVSASLRGVLAQRLVRRICPDCTASYTPTEKELISIGMTAADLSETNFQKGKGCVKCHNTGYRGRRGVFELFLVNEEVQEMIYRNATLVELRRKVRDLGMRTMREDGIRKIAAGITTVEEVLSTTVEVD
ncbi:MAG: Flp pilus assembly complex ATPase component TadA [Opitutae bacterium]|nr:Flp pilus assembly complex ATPase component TadA [Opitutae bacterium]MCD8299136.1 Flp pilus assembly complex ATPase component TadA [Opitutae bacterium]